MSAVVRVEVEWDGTQIHVINISDPSLDFTKNFEVADMVADAARRATDAVLSVAEPK